MRGKAAQKGAEMAKTDPSVFLAEGSIIKGNVEIGKGSSVWYNAVARAEEAPIRIGEKTNIQDCCVLHNDADYPLEIGNNVTIGHGAIIHGCTIEDNVIIGMGSIIMNGARIGKNSIIGAGSLITQNKVIPENSMAFGNPCRVVRETTQEERNKIADDAEHYSALARSYAKEK